jgi:hypothetical protein
LDVIIWRFSGGKFHVEENKMQRGGGRSTFFAGPIDTGVMNSVTYAILTAVGLAALVLLMLSSYMSALALQTLLFGIALILNLILCSVQAVVLINFFEYSKDHM